MKSHFVWADAWIFLAIVYSGSRKGLSVDRDAINQAADFINHDWPTDEEMRGALARLRDAGFVEEDNGKIKPTASMLEAYARIQLPGQQTLKEVQAIEQLLGVQTT